MIWSVCKSLYYINSSYRVPSHLKKVCVQKFACVQYTRKSTFICGIHSNFYKTFRIMLDNVSFLCSEAIFQTAYCHKCVKFTPASAEPFQPKHRTTEPLGHISEQIGHTAVTNVEKNVHKIQCFPSALTLFPVQFLFSRLCWIFMMLLWPYHTAC